VLQFDHARGYGFVAADDGGDDVFLHSSVFDGDPEELAPGTKVEFKIMAGDRGRKAFAARLGADDDADDEDGAGPPRRPQPVPAQAGPPHATPHAPVPPAPAPQPPAHAYRITTREDDEPDDDVQDDDEQLCDVLSEAEFGRELTELLLADVPALTGQQILDVRHSVLERAKKHGWVDI
jgi:cold shock protein